MPDPGIEGERFVVEEDGLVQGLQSTGAVEAWIWDRPDEVVLLLLALAEVDHDLEVQAQAVRVLQTSCSGAMALSYQGKVEEELDEGEAWGLNLVLVHKSPEVEGRCQEDVHGPGAVDPPGNRVVVVEDQDRDQDRDRDR
ncbi:unnamed protein product [Clonostachys chloroleuca]|uniref:Uncharacterized protein n=1 Tax=Clonostachys chloroleuca TaxID=1926264 RepID=A0AA35Q6L5_9HYPO|nr:unnamed protein product [Clonostachys chloroleuca]